MAACAPAASSRAAGTFRQIDEGVMSGKAFGDSKYKVYEAMRADQEHQTPILVVFLHGLSYENTPVDNLAAMHEHFGRRVVFFVPINPESSEQVQYDWACRYWKRDNVGRRDSLGHCFGQIQDEYLSTVCGKIKEVRCSVQASHVVLIGFSMGGFGVWQLGGFMPELFSAMVPIAGYGLGTTEPRETTWAPQPQCEDVFQRYVDKYARRWAQVPFILAIHAKIDTVSSYGDTLRMVQAVRERGGQVVLEDVPDESVLSRSGHNYYNYALQDDSSKDVLYARVNSALDAISRKFKVCVCGGVAQIREPLVRLLAKEENVEELAALELCDDTGPPDSVDAQPRRLGARAFVKRYRTRVAKADEKCLNEALTGCSLVFVPDWMPLQGCMTREEHFLWNVSLTKVVVEACARYCPQAVVAVMASPLNAIVPAMGELYKSKGLDPMKIVGVTTLAGVHATKAVAESMGANPWMVNVPLVGGYDGDSVVPLFSQDAIAKQIDAETLPRLLSRVRDAISGAHRASRGKTATVAMAHAGARLGRAILAGLAGRRQVECAYVRSRHAGLLYSTSRVVFGASGIKSVLRLGELTDYERKCLDEARVKLRKDIDLGLAFAERAMLSHPSL